MKLIVLVEGETEEAALSGFFRRWLQKHLGRAIAVRTKRYKGSQYLQKFHREAPLFLRDPQAIVIGLLDRYNWSVHVPAGTLNPYDFAKRSLEGKVNHSRFRQHFAVHELEAWLLSQPGIFPERIQSSLPKTNPEEVNHEEPPAALLKRLYRDHLGPRRRYDKVQDGAELFAKLDPAVAYEKCPRLRAMLDDVHSLLKEMES